MVSDAADGATDPVLARYLLDSAIVALRNADSRGPHALAEAAGIHVKTLQRWMNGQNAKWSQPQVVGLMAALGYGPTDPATVQLVQLAGDARKNNVVGRPEWLRSSAFDLLVALERVSDRVRNFGLTIVPGLLQVPDYARATYVAAGYRDESEIDERVQVRIDRQDVLTRSTDPIEYAAVMDEGVLHRAPTGGGVMRDQLEHLLEIGERPNATIQIVPYSIGPYATDGTGPFIILESQRVGRQITYVETFLTATYIETPEANKRYTDAWRRMANIALGPTESAEMIRGLLSSSTPRQEAPVHGNP